MGIIYRQIINVNYEKLLSYQERGCAFKYVFKTKKQTQRKSEEIVTLRQMTSLDHLYVETRGTK